MAASRTIGRMHETGSDIMGAILTKFEAKKAGYDYSYYYSYGKGPYGYGQKSISHSVNTRKKITIFSNTNSDENKEEPIE